MADDDQIMRTLADALGATLVMSVEQDCGCWETVREDGTILARCRIHCRLGHIEPTRPY